MRLTGAHAAARSRLSASGTSTLTGKVSNGRSDGAGLTGQPGVEVTNVTKDGTHTDRGPRRSPNRRAGMKEVAERAGVAMSSVSRVLSGHPDVSEGMYETVMAAVHELGYMPDMLAQGLRTQRTMSVGFAVSDISNPVLAETVTGAERRLREAGYSLLLTDAQGDAASDAADISLLRQRRVDGLLLSVADEHNAPTARALRESDIPMVLVDRDRPTGVVAAQALFDHRSGMSDASRYLVDLGHRHVALVIGGPRRPARQRREGIEAVMREAGPDGHCEVFEGDFSIEHGVAATNAVLGLDPRPTALVAGGNLLMHGALRALHAAGVEIGRDISFIGTDDVAVAEFHDPPIAVVRRDTREIGRVAADLLVDQMGDAADDETLTRRVTLPTEFIPRPSCAVPPS
jgi:LacI family transcriptional regulator